MSSRHRIPQVFKINNLYINKNKTDMKNQEAEKSKHQQEKSLRFVCVHVFLHYTRCFCLKKIAFSFTATASTTKISCTNVYGNMMTLHIKVP